MNDWICRIGPAIALAALVFQSSPASSAPQAGNRSGSPRSYEGPGGARVDCSNRKPLDQYKAAQEEKIKTLKDKKSTLEGRLTDASKTVDDSRNVHADADSKVEALEASKVPLSFCESRNLDTCRAEWRAKRNSAFNQLTAAQERLEGINAQIRDVDRLLAMYQDRQKTADNSYKEKCVCDEGFVLNHDTGECVDCRPQPGNQFPCGRGQRR